MLQLLSIQNDDVQSESGRPLFCRLADRRSATSATPAITASIPIRMKNSKNQTAAFLDRLLFCFRFLFMSNLF